MPLRLLASILLLATSAVAQPAASSPLQEQLHAIAAAHHGSVALYAENLQTHETVGLAADTPVQTASVIKLAILYEALEQMRAGRVHWDDRVPLTPADQVAGSGILRLLDAPKDLTFKDVLTLMIILSDNSATNLAIDHLGLASINDRIALLGLRNTHLYKKVFTPVAPGTVMPDDFKRFGLGKTTPHEITTVMAKLVTCDLATAAEPARPTDQALCDVAIHMLQLQFTRTGIPRYLDKLPGYNDSSIANKTGALEAVRNDVAAISTRRGMVLISAFTYANSDHSWSVEQEGELTLARLAQAIVSAWSPQGLAPWPKPAIAPSAPEIH